MSGSKDTRSSSRRVPRSTSTRWRRSTSTRRPIRALPATNACSSVSGRSAWRPTTSTSDVALAAQRVEVLLERLLGSRARGELPPKSHDLLLDSLDLGGPLLVALGLERHKGLAAEGGAHERCVLGRQPRDRLLVDAGAF